jgi:MFS transporter, FSR family, fosmidomycin resistance protein
VGGSGIGFVLTLLIIEFIDEFIGGAREAAWPLIRDDLALNYTQIGVLLAVPTVVSSLVEPFLGVLGDIGKRRILIVGGGVFFALALLLTGISRSYLWLLAGFVLFNPASGAFVSLSQASLMDVDPARRERTMALWTFAGSLGVVLGPLALAGVLALSFGWRDVFLATAGLAVALVLVASRYSFRNGLTEGEVPPRFIDAARGVIEALKRSEVLRWLVLLQFSDLMLDVLLGYLALYFVDVVGVPIALASAAVAVWSGVGLLGDFLLIPLLERVEGLRYLRISAVVELVLFVAFLLIRVYALKLAILAFLGLFNAGWYSILKARLYDTLPGRSGTVLAVYNVFGLTGALLPWLLGWTAERVGLESAMWLLALGPIALILGLPRSGGSDAAARTPRLGRRRHNDC